MKLWPHLAEQEPVGEGVWRVRLKEKGLCYFLPGMADANHFFLYDQEFEPKNPHHYTDPPIALGPESTVLDVGACEGLFAFRVLKSGLAGRVICFEPFPRMAGLIRRGAVENGVGEKLEIEPMAVGKNMGTVFYRLGTTVDGGAIAPRRSSESDIEVPVTTIDDYCAKSGLKLTTRDLIKIDAEGSDVDVLLGARDTIRECAPQIAVTTYHEADHARRIIEYLREIRPDYTLRLKDFSFWTRLPNPVLLQASCVPCSKSK